jgi:Mtr4-like, beta-barrel domain
VDPIKDLKIRDLDFAEESQLRDRAQSKMAQSKCHTCPKRQEHYQLVAWQQALVDEISDVQVCHQQRGFKRESSREFKRERESQERGRESRERERKKERERETVCVTSFEMI